MTLGGFFKTFLLLKRRKKRAAALGISEHRGSLLPEKQNENVFIALHVSLVCLSGFKVYHRHGIGEGPCFINLQMSSAIDGKGRPWVQLG